MRSPRLNGRFERSKEWTLLCREYRWTSRGWYCRQPSQQRVGDRLLKWRCRGRSKSGCWSLCSCLPTDNDGRTVQRTGYRCSSGVSQQCRSLRKLGKACWGQIFQRAWGTESLSCLSWSLARPSQLGRRRAAMRRRGLRWKETIHHHLCMGRQRPRVQWTLPIACLRTRLESCCSSLFFAWAVWSDSKEDALPTCPRQV